MVRFDPPTQPGCYLFKDKDGNIIYIGKAKNLRNRVASYFSNQPKTPKTALLVSHITDAEFLVVNDEVEALLLENRLIKQHRPLYNIDLKDDKRYAYLHVTAEEFPRLITIRSNKGKGKFFGPYTDGFVRREVQDVLQRIFRIRTCRTMPKTVCLLYHLKRCDGPCEKRIAKEDYARNIHAAEEVLRGKTDDVMARLHADMKKASTEKRFEAAKACRDQIMALEALSHRQSVDTTKHFDEDAIGIATDGTKAAIAIVHVRKGVISKKTEYAVDHTEDLLSEFIRAYYDTHDIPNRILVPQELDDAAVLEEWLATKRGTKVQIQHAQRGDAERLSQIASKNAQLKVESVHPGVVALKDALLLPSAPRVIEVFDISTLQGTNTVGAMVQYVNGQPNPSAYRKFIIREADAQDDFACMREVVGRRYKRLAEENAAFPDLIVIDGGAQQLSFAIQALEEVRTGVPIIALAKQEEEIYVPDASAPLRLQDKHAGLLLLRAARDSVHRFVLSFHRQRRGKAAVHSALDDIEGLGAASKKALIAHFGSVANVKKATLEELSCVVRPHIAKRVLEVLQKK